jgi:wyosine [tRNA(Phe)-imidazoG37] synthetase (radical SAM superfamily)
VTTPPKKCTYNCIYCQLGHTVKHVILPEDIADELPPTSVIIAELANELQRIDQSTIDVLTFSGTGEPTLNPNLGSIVSAVREITRNTPVILLSNASLFPIDEIRKGVLGFDIVTAKFDAGDEDTFKRINRPSKGSFSLQEIEDALFQLKTELAGSLALEVMLLHGPGGLTNIVGQQRKSLIEGIIHLNPDIVQIYTPWRPATISSIHPVSIPTLKKFGDELKQYFNPDQIWIYGNHDARGRAASWMTHQALEEEVLTLLRRRPCRGSDVALSLGITSAEATSILEKLAIEKHAKTRQVDEDIFYTIL